jgi:hypothetical protein
MKFGWQKRTPEKGKEKIDVRFFGGELVWKSQCGRHEPFEVYEPDNDDWDQLEDELTRRTARMNVDKRLLELVAHRKIR